MPTVLCMESWLILNNQSAPVSCIPDTFAQFQWPTSNQCWVSFGTSFVTIPALVWQPDYWIYAADVRCVQCTTHMMINVLFQNYVHKSTAIAAATLQEILEKWTGIVPNQPQEHQWVGKWSWKTSLTTHLHTERVQGGRSGLCAGKSKFPLIKEKSWHLYFCF